MNIKPMHISAWSRLGMNGAFYGSGLTEVFKNHNNTLAISADLIRSSSMDRLAKLFPDRVLNVGIQEQNMLSIACGLALEGNMVFASSYSAFGVLRAMEQVRQFMSVLQCNIKLVGFSAGLTMETLGHSHWATEDLALTRSLPSMTVISPADATEAVKAALAVSETEGPAYIRLCGGLNIPSVYQQDYLYEIGKGVVLKSGIDTVLIATGRMVFEALNASTLLDSHGICAGVVNIHTIKPLDTELILSCLDQYKHVYVVEEHSVIGGLGSAITEIAASVSQRSIIHRLGLRDKIYEVGSERFIWEQAGITSVQICDYVLQTLDHKII